MDYFITFQGRYRGDYLSIVSIFVSIGWTPQMDGIMSVSPIRNKTLSDIELKASRFDYPDDEEIINFSESRLREMLRMNFTNGQPVMVSMVYNGDKTLFTELHINSYMDIRFNPMQSYKRVENEGIIDTNFYIVPIQTSLKSIGYMLEESSIVGHI